MPATRTGLAVGQRLPAIRRSHAAARELWRRKFIGCAGNEQARRAVIGQNLLGGDIGGKGSRSANADCRREFVASAGVSLRFSISDLRFEIAIFLPLEQRQFLAVLASASQSGPRGGPLRATARAPALASREIAARPDPCAGQNRPRKQTALAAALLRSASPVRRRHAQSMLKPRRSGRGERESGARGEAEGEERAARGVGQARRGEDAAVESAHVRRSRLSLPRF